MRRIILSLFFLAMVGWLFGQNTKSYNAGNAKRVEIYLEQSALTITAYAGSEILIETDNYQPPPDRAKGLKPLYNTNTDNSGIGLSIEKSTNGIVLRKASGQEIKYRMKVPAQTDLKISEEGWWGGDFKIAGMKGEIEITANNSAIELLNVSGPIVANSTSSDITITMSDINQNKPSAISTISGFIDISLPPTTKANFEMKGITGEIYTDFTLEMDKKNNMKRIGGSEVKGKINGGGVNISLNVISGDIFLRKL
ncbi:MAG: hypothetical protein DHS20C18_19810 [Saprospiraceae bacterium]|nr:MAG: hypothetical protein DHS20C18_19810 [Saprospiraceae bacterium]